MEKAKEIKRRSIKWTLLGMALAPVIVVAVIMGWISTGSLREGMQEEALTGLKYTCTAVNAGYEAMSSEPYTLSEDGHMMKGDFDLSADETVIDSWTKGFDIDVTLFYGDTRMSTSLRNSATGERMVGTQASPEVKAAVLDGGQEYETTKVEINGKNYYAFYMPLKNPDGSTVGMIFAGEPSEDIDRYINQRLSVIAGIAILLVLIFVVICFFIASKTARVVAVAKQIIEELSKGNLAFKLDPAVHNRILGRKDELGDMGRAINELNEELHTIIGGIQKSADNVLTAGDELEGLATQTSRNADEISCAVDDISKGAVSQAEEIETATGNVADMGNLIERMVVNISRLNDTALIMQKAGDESSEIMKELSASNDMTSEAIYKVSETVEATDDSVNRIMVAVDLITNIASQTNLLSLNASIEAARAGEAGRGFAVVASEIQKLAEESNQSAQQISEILNVLSEDSKNSLKLMDEVKTRLKQQQEKLAETMKKADDVSSGIDSSRRDTEEINHQAEECDKDRGGLVDIIQNLSAISEENAASTEETTASMEELNATINLVAESAVKLKGLAEGLEEATRFFKL